MGSQELEARPDEGPGSRVAMCMHQLGLESRSLSASDFPNRRARLLGFGAAEAPPRPRPSHHYKYRPSHHSTLLFSAVASTTWARCASYTFSLKPDYRGSLWLERESHFGMRFVPHFAFHP